MNAVEAARAKPLRLPPGMRWQAGRDRIGHLLPRAAGYTRYLCNRMPISDRFAWPMLTRCPECVRLLGAGGRS